MRNIKILFVIISLALVSLACGFDFNLPVTTDIKTGPTRTDEINVELLEDSVTPAEVTLEFAAGELYLSPGAGDLLLGGEAVYNIEDLKPEISNKPEGVKIETGNYEFNGFPNFKGKIINTWDLELGTMPVNLSIKAGAYTGEYELGDLSISNLHISDGASSVYLNFEKPNLVEMKSLRYETGASDISLENLANANFDTMIFESGAGSYELDFSGQLQRDASVFIETGLSSMTITVPANMNVKLSFEGGLAEVTNRGTWDQSGNYYSITGDGPTLTISVQMNAGNLILRNP
jgi:hypothetical protein